MTAKPQPMAGQSEAPDDLIAELAKLMAQDAKPAPAQPAAPTFTVRIPGESTAAPMRAEPVRNPEAPATPHPSSPVPRAAEPVRTQPAAEATPPAPSTTPDPFRFSFDLGQQQAPVAAKPAASAPQVVAEAPPAAPSSDHDSIADLIAAELAMDSAPTPRPVAPTVAAQPVVVEKLAAPRPEPTPNANWAPVNVPTNLGRQDQPAQSALRQVNLQPTRPEQDKFKVPPVFGLGTTQSPPSEPRSREPVRAEPPMTAATVEPSFAQAPTRPSQSPTAIAPIVTNAGFNAADDNVGLDPIDEIESLIGRSVRVDLDKQQEPNAAPERPAPRSLATPSLPKATPAGPRGYSSADEAVLAAAQSSGAEIGWVEASDLAEVAPRKGRQKRVKPERVKAERVPRSGGGLSRALAGPLVALTLLLAAGFGLYWVLGMSGQSGPAPLLTADATPTKETPAVTPETGDAQQSVVFNEMDGVVPGAEEQLVSRDQADVNEVTQVAATPDVSEEGLANRKVRTVTVRPDGTIVSGEDSVAGSTILPVARPNVPVIDGAETASPELLASASATAPVTTTPTTTAVPATSPETPVAAAPVQIVTPGATVPGVDAAGNPLAGVTTVIPLQRPSSFAQPARAAIETTPDNALAPTPATQTQTATAPAGQPSASVPGATEVEALGNDAPAYVQLASQRTEAEARTTAQGLVTRYGPLFGGANMEVQRVDLGTRGIYYRVRVPASSVEQANNICVNVKAAGGDCYTM